MSQTRNIKQEYGALDIGGYSVSSLDNYSELAGDTTLTLQDSGKSYYLNDSSGFDITLPNPADASGFVARFFVKAAPSGGDNYTISSNSNNIHGNIVIPNAGTGSDAPSSGGTGQTNVDIVAGTAVVGDFVELRSDGANYHLLGVVNVSGAVALS